MSGSSWFRSGLSFVTVMLASLAFTGFAYGEASPYQGEWRQVDFDGVSEWDTGLCAGVYFNERVLNIFPQQAGTSTLKGNQVTLRHGRLIRKGKPDCRLPDTGETAPYVYENMATWDLIARAEEGKDGLRVEGSFDEAKGDRCSNCTWSSFKTYIKMESGALRDTYGTEDPGDDLWFRTESDRAGQVKSGQEAARRFTSLIDAGNYSGAYQMVSSRLAARMSEAAWVEEGKRLFGALGNATSRSIQEKYFVNRAWDGKSHVPCEMVYFTNHITTPRGGALEFLLLEKEAIGWRVVMYYVAA